MNPTIDLQSARYISLATFRKSGAKVATPVWLAPDSDSGTPPTACFVFSAGQAGKVKRLRNSSEAEVALCDVRGKVLSPWQPAEAHIIDDPQTVTRALHSFRSKYRLQMWLADIGSKLTGKFNRRAYLRVVLKPTTP